MLGGRGVRTALNVAGVVFVAIGAVGIVVPVLPTTPFLLLASACFLRSSPRLHRWLLSHPRLGPYVAGYVGGGGLSARAKRRSISALWTAIGLSAFLTFVRFGLAVVSVGISLVLLIVAISVTRYIAGRPTVPEASGPQRPPLDGSPGPASPVDP
ncbi:Inner membrane protein YbaN [bacterium HR12]|nr:Inner membrane protein YbaN [bacterium HR12]